MKVAQLCLALCDLMDYTVHGIFQARILEWVVFPFSRGLPNPGIKPTSPILRADSLPGEPQGSPRILKWYAIPFSSGPHSARNMEKAREFQKNIYFCFIGYAKAFDSVDSNKLWKILKEMGIPDHLT